MALMIVLRAVGNPDFGEPPDIGVPARNARVKDLAEASRVAREFIEKNDLGGGNWAGGQVFDGPRQVAYVSYNGRVWTDACHLRR